MTLNEQLDPGRESEGGGRSPAAFPTTHWSLVLDAGAKASPGQSAALEWLCRNYWPPVHAFIRHRVRNSELARDLTQEFFMRLLNREWLDGLGVDGAKFRSFLLTCVSRFLINEHERGQAQKRGGGVEFVSLDAFAEEERQPIEPADSARAETAFDRRWAEAVLARANARLRAEFVQAGEEARFEALKRYLVEDAGTMPYADTAARIGLSVSAVKAAIHRLRQRWGEAVREEVAATVARPEQVEIELRHLLEALSDPSPVST